MTSIVTGNQLGLTNTSLNTLGLQNGDAATGRSGEDVYVNAATGNLVVQQQDEILKGTGLDVGVLRTYNSQGSLDGDNNDNWRIGFYRQLKDLNGTQNTLGSSVVRVDADGAELRYTYDLASGSYINTDGTGSYDTLRYDAMSNQWTWLDGDSRLTEHYDWNAGTGKLLNQADANGNTVSYTYNLSNLLTKVTTANSDGMQFNYIELMYDKGIGTANNLLSIKTSYFDTVSGTNKTLTRVSYTYDNANRLQTVAVDYTPGDSLDLAGSYVTTYSYVDALSKRISNLSQSDGTSLSFTYDSNGRVTSIQMPWVIKAAMPTPTTECLVLPPSRMHWEIRRNTNMIRMAS